GGVGMGSGGGGGRGGGGGGRGGVREEGANAGSRRADGKTLAAQLSQLRERLRALVENEYRRIEHPAQRSEMVRIAGPSKAERGERRLHLRGRVAQQIQVFHRAGGVADLQVDAVASQYPGVALGEVVIPGLRYAGSDDEVTRRKRIDQSIGDVQTCERDGGCGEHDDRKTSWRWPRRRDCASPRRESHGLRKLTGGHVTAAPPSRVMNSRRFKDRIAFGPQRARDGL